MKIETLHRNCLSDNLGKLYIDEAFIVKEKSNLKEDITLDKIKLVLGRKYKKAIHRILPICSYIITHQYSSFIQLPTTYNYSQYTKHLFIHNLPLCNTFANLENKTDAMKMSNSRAIQDMKELGLIRCISDMKHFNDPNNNNLAYAYVFSISSIYSLLSIFNISYHIHYNNITNLPLCNTFAEEEPEMKHSKLYYKFLPFLQNELCRQTTKGDFRYYLKADGKRPYCYFCSSEKTTERKAILDEYFGKGKWHEWDRSASIYNLTYSYNTGKYIENSVDLHAKMNGKEFHSKEEREMFKLLNMTKYFSDARKVKSFMEKIVKISEKIKNNKAILNTELSFYKNNAKRAEAMIKLSNSEDIETWEETIRRVVEYYKTSRKDMENIIGKKLPKDVVFIIEGIVNLATMNELNEIGYKCISVYDGFYTDCNDDKLIEEIYRKNIEKIVNL